LGRKCLTFHLKESPNIVWGEGGAHINQEPTLDLQVGQTKLL
jgi:hypothetical protein